MEKLKKEHTTQEQDVELYGWMVVMQQMHELFSQDDVIKKDVSVTQETGCMCGHVNLYYDTTTTQVKST